MKTCDCGHEHCCHKDEVRTTIHDTNEVGKAYSFIRKKCAQCGKWLGDQLL